MSLVKERQPIGCVELILQSGPEENAAAALAMVLSYYGRPANLEDLARQRIASAADLVSAAQSRGLYAQGYQMSYAELCRAPMPLIAHWRFRSFVVVTGVRGGKVYVNSPEEGTQVLSRRAFEAGFTGVAICFAGGAARTDEGGENRTAVRAAAPAVTALLAAAQLFVAVCYGILAIQFRTIAAGLSSSQTGGGLSVCLGLGGVVLLQAAAVAGQLWLLRRCRRDRSEREVRALRELLDSGEAARFRRIDGFRLDVLLRGCAGGPAAAAGEAACVLQLVSAAVCLAAVAVQDLVAGVFGAAVAAVFAVFCLRSREALYSDVQMAARERFYGADQAAADLERLEESRLRGENQARFQRWASRAGGAFRPAGAERLREVWYIAAAGELLLVLCACLMEMTAGRAGTADLLGCVALAAAAAVSMGALPELLAERALSRWLREEADRTLPGAEDTAPAHSGAAAETLTVQNVSLRTSQGGKLLAKGVTFTVRRGEILVVAGEEAVRTALAGVVSGLERPAQGEVYLGSVNAAELGSREVSGNITLLGGVPFPEGTVRENIAAGIRSITDYAVMEAASDALLHRSILLRGSGYDTPVRSLSEGEKILLEFACAFAQGTPFLVCDGLTGRLDAETEDQLIGNLRRRGVGAVLLTEDQNLLRRGDVACRIEEGRTTLRERGIFVEEEVRSLV